MPELPDLEIIRRYLAPRLEGVSIAGARVHRPTVMRNLVGGELAEALVGRRFRGVKRRGKFLLLELEEGPSLVINPMLAGRIRYGGPLPKDRVRDALIITLADGQELRYHDAADMGKVYLVTEPAQVPTFGEQGPDADAEALTLDVFRQSLRRYNGEIKGVLTNQTFIAGIGNAYADEICWCAAIYPFRRRAALSQEEVERLYHCLRTVVEKAIDTLEARVGSAIDVEVRDFLAVHGKPGEPCPRCGSKISKVTLARRETHFCRTCQPGLMVERRGRRLERTV